MVPLRPRERYEKVRRIGHGLCSDVYLAIDRQEGADVALKVTEPMDDRKPHNSRLELAVLKEIRGRHGTVVQLLDDFELQDELFMVFPLLRCTLADLLSRYSRPRVNLMMAVRDDLPKKGAVNRFPTARADHIVRAMVSALAFLHGSGVIHRDLKPENIMFAHDENDEPILIDFGISWKAPNNRGTEPADQKVTDVATGIYKAPELIMGMHSYTDAIDIWALGVLMTELYAAQRSVLDIDSDDISDIALFSKILEVFGTEQLDQWEEVKNVDTFQALRFNGSQPPLDIPQVLPRCQDPRITESFTKMMVYESTMRISALNAMETLKSAV